MVTFSPDFITFIAPLWSLQRPERERGGGGGLEKTCHVLPKVSRKASGSSLSLFEKIGDLRSCRNNPFIQHIPPLPLACQCDLP